jgi:hypothetical protein
MFGGCKPDAAGACHLTARFEVFDPKGKSYAVQDGAVLLDGPPPPPGNFGLGASSLGMRIEGGEALGDYRMVVKTTDKVAGISVTTQDILTITEAPLAGGWHPIKNPNSVPELRGVAKAILAKLPGKNPRLAKIERAESQVVAGTNYRMVVRLKDGARWTATVWRKLDGSFEVSGVARVR